MAAFVDPSKVPCMTLHTGAKIPVVGLGTFGSDKFTNDEIASAVGRAIDIGYRHIDCAQVYGNEAEIGRVLSDRINSEIVKREELFITSKLWNDKHGEADVIPACQKTLRDLRVDYLDLYLSHWPFPNYHAPGCDVSSRSPDAKPYIHENYMKTWRQLEKLVDMGLVRHIGCSNMTIPKLSAVLRDARIKPSCIEMELHPHFQQSEFLKFVQEQGIIPIAYSPIGSPKRPDRDRTEADTVDVEDPVIISIAERLGVHPAVVCVKWSIQRGCVPIPFSVNEANYYSNLACTQTPPLTDQDMSAIATIDRNCRLIKGQVFLWKDNQSWEDLWEDESWMND